MAELLDYLNDGFTAVDIPTDKGKIVAIKGSVAIESRAIPGGEVLREIAYAQPVVMTPDGFHRYQVSFVPKDGLPEPAGNLLRLVEGGLAEVSYPARTAMRRVYGSGGIITVAKALPAEIVYVRLTDQFVVSEMDGIYEAAYRAAATLDPGGEVELYRGNKTRVWVRRTGGVVELVNRTIGRSDISIRKVKLAEVVAGKMVKKLTVSDYEEWVNG